MQSKALNHQLQITMQNTNVEVGKTGVISDQRMLLHRSRKTHPESPIRLTAIIRHLQSRKYLTHPSIDYVASYDRLATDEEIGWVYPPEYIEYVRSLWPKHSHRTDITVLDTYFGEESARTARISAAGVLEGIDKVVGGHWRNGFALIRPPGHHSGGHHTINGFCIFNNVAIGARYLQKRWGFKKVAIVDYDIHQGDGTHRIFIDDPSVLFLSVHRYDHGAYYPSTEGADYPACGSGEAKGSKLNIPLNKVNKQGSPYLCQPPGDNEYIYIYDRMIHPILSAFEPDFILVSSGFDAARWDPVGGFSVTPNAYYYITRRLMELKKPMLCVLEGGYNFHQTALAVSAVVGALVGEEALPEAVSGLNYHTISLACQIQPHQHHDLDQIIEHHTKYWKALATQELAQYTQTVKQNQVRKFGVVKDEEPEGGEGHGENLEEVVPKQDSTQFHFAAGHMQRFKNLSTANDKILKWAYPEQRNFYQSGFPETAFAPKYYGLDGEYIAIENVLYQVRDPIVLDVKMSRQSRNTHNNPDKVAKEQKKQQQSTSHEYSFRIGGFTTPDYKEGGLLIPDEATNRKILRKVVCPENKELFCGFLRGLAAELRKVSRKYFGTSILLVRGQQKSAIKWVDFHYWYECESYDVDLVEGLQNLQKFINTCDSQ